jgi:hypothetical protein
VNAGDENRAAAALRAGARDPAGRRNCAGGAQSGRPARADHRECAAGESRARQGISEVTGRGEPPLKPQAAVDPAAACGRDELRLARLPSDPVPDEVSRLRVAALTARARSLPARMCSKISMRNMAVSPIATEL